MPGKLKVRAVEGKTCPHEYSRTFVGYRAAAEGDDVHHVIPVSGVDSRGSSVDRSLHLTRTDDAVEVPDNIYYRAAVRVGDLEQVSDEPRNALTSAPKKGG